MARKSAREKPVADLVFPFDHRHTAPLEELPDLLGGKGAGLAVMTSVLHLPVPPGFTISVPACARWRERGRPVDLDEVVRLQIHELEERIGRRFGDRADPLLLAVRSGAPRSMPGMLDTVLNVGLNDETVEGLAVASGDPIFAWDSYLRFLTMYSSTVLGVESKEKTGARSKTVCEARARVSGMKSAIADAGESVPHDAFEQLAGAIEAVVGSWHSPRALAFRGREGIDDSIGTAVNVQAMVFGNLGPESGTGVVFTRDPSTGADRPVGDFLPRAQGEEVVAGTTRTLAIEDMTMRLPAAMEALATHLYVLERHFQDTCEVEFTVERGTLWLLQTRVAKRSAVAAVRIAAAMLQDSRIALSRDQARERVPQEVLDAAREAVLRSVDRRPARRPLVWGVGASPGRATARVVIDVDTVADSDVPVVLVRPETNPKDVHGMAASAGVLTSTGGLASHAAVVARGWGIPAVVSADALVIGPDEVHDHSGELLFKPGDVVTIDGTTGAVWLGSPDDDLDCRLDDDAVVLRELPELPVLRALFADGH